MCQKEYLLNALLLCVLSLGLGVDARSQVKRHTSMMSPRPNLLKKLTVQKKIVLVFEQPIAYYEAGQGRTLVLLAQLGWDSHMWAQNLPALAKDYRVIALDLLGTGESAKPHIEYKMDTWTDFVAEFLRQKGIRKATIIGSVMGGALAVQFALDHPEMSDGLVCAASNSGPGKHEGGVKQPANWPSLAGVKRGLMSWFHDKSLVTDELVRARFKDRLRINDGYTIERHLSDHRAPYTMQELSTIRVPALFIWCREDEITPLSWGEDFAAAVSGAQLAVIEGCGHFPNLEKPTEFNSAVAVFLRKKKTPNR
jgi:pimeloyl-ACP methyl ester carboxylesterase